MFGWWARWRVRGSRREQAEIARARLAAVTAGQGWIPPSGRDLITTRPDREPTEEVVNEMVDAPPEHAEDAGRDGVAADGAGSDGAGSDGAGSDGAGSDGVAADGGSDGAPAGDRVRVGDWLRSEWGRTGWAPTTGRGLRLDPGRRAALAAVLAAVVAAAIAAIVTWRMRPVEEHVAVAPGSAVASVSAAPSTGGEQIVVAVAGKVRRPGLVRLPPGSRVADAIDAAGGLRLGARLGLLNLAQPLADGQQVVVGLSDGGASGGGAPVPPAGTSAGGLINLNTAPVEQLEELPGVGPVTAQAIVDWREESGPFRSVDQLREVSGIGEVRFGQLAELVTI